MSVLINLPLVLAACLVGTALCHFSPSEHEDEEVPTTPLSSSPSPVSDHRFFLREIFSKYGRDGQMNFEGFEHLLESLGLGNIIIKDHDVEAHKGKDFLHGSHDHDRNEDPDDHHHNPTHRTTASHAATTASLNHYSHNALPTPAKVDDGGAPGENDVYPYRFREAKIPELLVNISSLIDQHQELVDQTPEIVIEQVSAMCLSPKEILETFGINQTSSLNPVSFLHLCPAIIYELDQGHCIFRGQAHRKGMAVTTLYQWIYSCGAVLVISLCGLLSVAVIPLMQRRFYHTLLQFFVGLAVGTLSGDALMHLLPHAMMGGHDNLGGAPSEKRAVWHGLAALGGAYFFFVAERLLGALARYRQPKPPAVYAKNSLEMSEKEKMKMLSGDVSRKGSLEDTNLPAKAKPDSVIAVEQHHGHGHSHTEVPDSVSAVAWMVIMGDGLHNFCDGLAIGAAFAAGIEGGISTTVAVFCHELPHELGDFAMLLKTGMRVKEALFYNGLSSVLCFVGMVIGVSLGNVHSASSWVFAGTAGMFLYIALVDMLPELTSQSSDKEVSSTHQLAIQVLGICFGISIMFVIANYEQDLQSIVS